MAKSKMDDVMDDMLGSKSTKLKKDIPESKGKPREEDSYIRVNFNISKGQKDKLKQYTKEIAPAHLKISQSQLIRYMIENFDISRAREEFFKTKY
jgi:allophanate hydrolase subunit 2